MFKSEKSTWKFTKTFYQFIHYPAHPTPPGNPLLYKNVLYDNGMQISLKTFVHFLKFSVKKGSHPPQAIWRDGKDAEVLFIFICLPKTHRRPNFAFLLFKIASETRASQPIRLRLPRAGLQPKRRRLVCFLTNFVLTQRNKNSTMFSREYLYEQSQRSFRHLEVYNLN